MTDEWTPPPHSPAARLDEQEYLKRRVAEDLRKFEPPKRPQPVADTISRRDLERAMDGLVKTIAKACKELVVAPLVKRIAELEAERGLKYVGPWKVGGDYNPGEFVSYGGGIWHCKQHTGTRPNSCPRRGSSRSNRAK